MTLEDTQHLQNNSKCCDATISVVIAGRNPGDFLTEMLESLVHQTDPPDEIIYYDDCSDDDSLQILERYRPELKSLKVIAGKEKIGISTARNIANGAASSEFIAVLDSDDFFLNDTIEKYRNAIKHQPAIDLLYADTLVFKEGSNRSWRMNYPSFVESPRAKWCLMTSPVLPFKHSSILYRKSTIEKVGGYCEDLPLKIDFDLFVRFMKNEAMIKKLDTVTSHHRTHRNQVSKDRIRGITLYWKIIDWHESRFFFASLYKILRALGELAKQAVGR